GRRHRHRAVSCRLPGTRCSASLTAYVLLLTLPPPPRSPLFPYTTLFRSDEDPTQPQPKEVDKPLPQVAQPPPPPAEPPSPPPGADRKSTRLNSSHVSISYAVFCLTKNTRPSTPTHRAHTKCTQTPQSMHS